ncbi:hypothetical protein INT47_005933 [Mucor saturninus]|uniref:Uncharacterized protein n=1 Tax=Mucor saturninus TaxID=64648 RepID=A0A8H7R977_9FUNG|nr:hypothetical protein INT47_005933 [Mucor saturninus]
MDNYCHLLHHNEKKTIRENEYLRLIWSYILEQLFRPKGIIRVVTGESENAYSTEIKKEQYPEAKSLRGFKIDIRLVVEVEDGENDVAVGECAKNNDDNKAINDNGKLLRECKDNIDGLVYNLRNADDEVMSYMIQITGPSCVLSTIHLAVNGLYISKHRHTFNIPHSFDNLSSLSDTLSHLLTMKRELQLVADKVIKERKKTHTAEDSFNRHKMPIMNDKLSCICYI